MSKGLMLHGWSVIYLKKWRIEASSICNKLIAIWKEKLEIKDTNTFLFLIVFISSFKNYDVWIRMINEIIPIYTHTLNYKFLIARLEWTYYEDT